MRTYLAEMNSVWLFSGLIAPGLIYYFPSDWGGEEEGMVALKNERRIFLWRLTPRPIPKEAPKPVTLEEVVAILETAKAAKNARVYVSAGGRVLEDDDPNKEDTNQIYVAEIKRHSKKPVITLLINRGDPNVPATAFLKPNDNAVRIEQPTRGEVTGWSAHLVISTKLESTGAHRACFEQMSRVSSALALDAIDTMVERTIIGSPKYTYEKIVKTGHSKTETRVSKYRPTLGLERVPSERLIDDLNVGELSGVTLSKPKISYTGVGSAPVITSQEEKLVIHTAPADAGVVKTFVRNIELFAKQNNFRSITFQLRNLPGDRSNSPTIMLDDQDALEHLYVRAQRIEGFPVFLENCYPSVYSEIEDRMISILLASHGWT